MVLDSDWEIGINYWLCQAKAEMKTENSCRLVEFFVLARFTKKISITLFVKSFGTDLKCFPKVHPLLWDSAKALLNID